MKTAATLFLILGLLFSPAFAEAEKETPKQLVAVSVDQTQEVIRLARESGATNFDEKVLDLLYELCEADSLQLDRTKGVCH